MELKFKVMNKDLAEEMNKWEYNGEYFEELEMKHYFDSYDEATGIATGPAGCDGYAVFLENGQLIGLFEYYLKDEFMEIGLAHNPSMIGKGLGVEFVTKGIEFGIEKYDYKEEYIKLNVDEINVPAIRVYEKAGFKKIKEVVSDDGKNVSMEMRKYI